MPRMNSINPASGYQHTTLSVGDGSRLVPMNRQNTNQPPMFTLFVNNSTGPPQGGAPSGASGAPVSHAIPQQPAYAPYPTGQEYVAAPPTGFRPPFYYPPTNGHATLFMQAPNSAALYPTQGGWATAAGPAQGTLQAYPTTSTIYNVNVAGGTQAMVQQPPPMIPGPHPIAVKTTAPVHVAKRDRHPLQIIDPNTNKDVLQEFEREKEEQQPSSLLLQQQHQQQSSGSSAAQGGGVTFGTAAGVVGGAAAAAAGPPLGAVYYSTMANSAAYSAPGAASGGGPPPPPYQQQQQQPTSQGQPPHQGPPYSTYHHPAAYHVAQQQHSSNKPGSASNLIATSSSSDLDTVGGQSPQPGGGQGSSTSSLIGGGVGQSQRPTSTTAHPSSHHQQQQHQHAALQPSSSVNSQSHEKSAAYSEFALGISMAAFPLTSAGGGGGGSTNAAATAAAATTATTTTSAATSATASATSSGPTPAKQQPHHQQSAPPSGGGPVAYRQQHPPHQAAPPVGGGGKAGSFPQTYYQQQQKHHTTSVTGPANFHIQPQQAASIVAQTPPGGGGGAAIVVEFDAAAAAGSDVITTTTTSSSVAAAGAKSPPARPLGAGAQTSATSAPHARSAAPLTSAAGQPQQQQPQPQNVLDIQRSTSGGALVDTKKGPAPAPAQGENVSGVSFGFFDDSGGSPGSSGSSTRTPSGARLPSAAAAAADRSPASSGGSTSSASPEKLGVATGDVQQQRRAVAAAPVTPDDEVDSAPNFTKVDRERTAFTSTPTKTDARLSSKDAAAIAEVSTNAIVSTSEREMPATVVIDSSSQDSMVASFSMPSGGQLPPPGAGADASLEEGELRDTSALSLDAAEDGSVAASGQAAQSPASGGGGGHLSGSVTPTPSLTSQQPPLSSSSTSTPGRSSSTSTDVESIVNELRTKKLPGAWFYDNPDGSRTYTRDYIFTIMKLPSSNEYPTLNEKTSHELPDVLCTSKRKITGGDHAARLRLSAALTDPRGPPQGMPYQFQVSWQQISASTLPKMKYTGRGSSGGLPGRASQGGGASGGGGQSQQGGGKSKGGGGGPPPMIIPRPSLNAEVQLKRAENAWKPIRKQQQDESSKDPEQIKTDDLNRTLKSILNKITPQTFDELCGDFLDLEAQMDTEERTLGVIDILFNKVCDEPSFCEIYGQLCEALKAKQQKAQQQAQQPGLPPSGAAGTPQQPKLKNFSYYLLIKCQNDFEREKNSEMYKEERLKQIEEAETEEEKNKLRENLTEDLNKYKWRMLGSIRFVGELYKRGLLTKFLAHICVTRLLDRIRANSDEESVECLCKLLTTIGKKMEEDKTVAHVHVMKRVPADAVQQYFDSLQAILNEQKLSKRIQFAIKDLIELRKNNWIPRRKEAGPMKIEEVHSAARLEEITKKVELDQLDQMKKQHHHQQQQPQMTGGGGGGGPGGSMSGGQSRGGPQQPGRVPQRGSTGSNLGGYGGPGGGGLDYDDDGGNVGGGPIGGGGGRQQKRGSQRDQGGGGRQKGGDRNRQQNVQAAPSHQDQRSIQPGSLSKHLHTAEITLGPQRGAYKMKPGSSGVGAGPTTQIANRYSSLATDDEMRRRDSAPNSRDSSQSRPPMTSSAMTDRRSALDAAAGMVRSSTTTAAAGGGAMGGGGGPSSSASTAYSFRPNRVPFQPGGQSSAVTAGGGPPGDSSASSSREQSLTRSRGHRNKDEDIDDRNANLPSSDNTATKNVAPGDKQQRSSAADKAASSDPSFSGRCAPLSGNNNNNNNNNKGCANYGDDSSSASDNVTATGKPPLAHTSAGPVDNKKMATTASKLLSASSSHSSSSSSTTDVSSSATTNRNKENINNNNNNNTTNKESTRLVSGSRDLRTTTDDGENHQQRQRHADFDTNDDYYRSEEADGHDHRTNGNFAESLDPELIELRRFVHSMDPIDPDQLLKWIGDNVSEHTRAKDDFARALARSLCSKIFSSTENDNDLSTSIDQFEQCCRVFQRHVTSNSRAEQRLLSALAEFYYNNGCPRDFLANTFNILSDAQVVPRESFLEWWRLENRLNKSGMILKNNQLNQFFNTLSRQQDDKSSSTAAAMTSSSPELTSSADVAMTSSSTAAAAAASKQ